MKRIFYAEYPLRMVRDIKVGEEFYIHLNETAMYIHNEKENIARLVFYESTSAFYKNEILEMNLPFFIKMVRRERGFSLLESLEDKIFLLKHKGDVPLLRSGKNYYVEGEVRIFQKSEQIPLEMLSEKELNFLLQEAIREEQYEYAARIKKILQSKKGAS